MVNKRFLLGILVMVFGLVLAGCKDDADDGLKVLISLDPMDRNRSYEDCTPATTATVGQTLYAIYKMPSNYIIGSVDYYDWYRNGEEISDADSYWYETTEAGSYTVTVGKFKPNSLERIEATSKAVIVN